jgi:hypothetical protein
VPDWSVAAIDYGVFPALLVIGIAAFILCTVRGDWRAGIAIGLQFWVASGLVKLSLATTWGSIAMAAIIIAVRNAAIWSIHRADAIRTSSADRTVIRS